MFKKILFATTGSPSCDHAAEVAFHMAEINDSELILFHVLGIPSQGFSREVIDSRTGDRILYDEDYVHWVIEEMNNTYRRLIEKSSKCRLEAVSGIPNTEILRYSRKNDIDLIIMGSGYQEEPKTSFYRRFAGKTLQAVTKSARCPVLIIGKRPTSSWEGFSKIVFGTDFSKSCDSAFIFASKIARSLACKLYIFHALDIAPIHSGKNLEQCEIEKDLMDAKDGIKTNIYPKFLI